MIYLEGEATGFHTDEPAHTNPHVRRNRSLRKKRCVCFDLFCLKKNGNGNYLIFFFQERPDLWTLPLFTAWNKNCCCLWSSSSRKWIFEISQVLNHFKIDFGGFHSAHKIRKINPQQFLFYHPDVISLCGGFKYFSVYLRAAQCWVYVSESDMTRVGSP